MSLLPWLLDWAPTPRQVLSFVAVTALVLGTLYVYPTVPDGAAEDTAAVRSVDLDVRLNDETTWPDGNNGTVRSCLASGTPGDHVGVYGTVTVEVPRKYSDGTTVVVSLASTDRSTVQRVAGAGNHTRNVYWLVEDDEGLTVGGDATVQIRLRSGERTLAATNRTLAVTEARRTYDC